jgi:hypothetical protein
MSDESVPGYDSAALRGDEPRPKARWRFVGVAALASVAAGAALLVALPVCACKSQEGVAWHGAKTLVAMGEPWRAQNPGRECPGSPEELVSASGRRAVEPLDPWGVEYALLCAGGDIEAVSAGPDKVFGTADDIASFMPQPKDEGRW